MVAVTIANGADNIGIYTPYFATHPVSDVVQICGIFVVLTALWMALSYKLVNHPWIGKPFRLYGRTVVPFVLIGLGLLILYQAGSVSLLGRLLGE